MYSLFHNAGHRIGCPAILKQRQPSQPPAEIRPIAAPLIAECHLEQNWKGTLMVIVKTVKSYCNDCLQTTNHDLVGQRERVWINEDDEGVPVFEEKMVYELVQCRGCENVSLKRTYSNSSDQTIDVDYFPPAVSRRRPRWFSDLGFMAFAGPKAEIRGLLSEIYSAMFSGNMRLALMGTRTVVDVALTDKLGDVGGFEKKLDDARAKGWITSLQRKVLAAVIDAGSAAAHRSHKPEKKQMELVLDVVEHLIQLLYILEKNADEISKEIPGRAPKKTK
ncbi:MAG: DUF4145 domain-containing protein [Tepidisphaeraceae bacterium]